MVYFSRCAPDCFVDKVKSGFSLGIIEEMTLLFWLVE